MLEENALLRIVAILLVAAAAHLLVLLLRRLSLFLVSRQALERRAKLRSILGLLTSVAIFAVYFAAVGYSLAGFGISLTAYFASATVIGLAVGFGSQGLVQDVVTGLTLVFSDLIDVDEMVEISGQVGIVRSIGMRFVVLENAMGARVYIPNRSIGNVINYPKGYVRCLLDVTLAEDQVTQQRMIEQAERMMRDFGEQFPNILIAPASSEGARQTASGKRFLRLKFRIWPGRGGPLETLFRQELVKRLQAIEPSYSDWMVSALYETEKPGRVRRGRKSAAS